MANRLLYPHEVHPWLIDPKAPRPQFLFVHEIQKMVDESLRSASQKGGK